MSVRAEVAIGGRLKLNPTPYDAGNHALNGRRFAYASSAPGIVAIDSDGLITGVAIGSALITATAEGKSASATVHVIPPVNSITLSPNPVRIQAIGGAAQLVPTLLDVDGNAAVGQVPVYTTSDPAIATVSNTGLVTSIGYGSCTITATVGTVSATTVVYSGPYAGVMAVSATEGVELLRFNSARVATTDLIGAQTVPQVPGMPSGGVLTAYQNGGGNTQRPTYDDVNKIVRTNAGGATALVSNWNGDLDLSLYRGMYIVFIGAVNFVGAGTACMGVERPSNLNENFILSGSFFGSYLDAFLNTPGGHQYNWSTFYANNASALKLFALRIPPAGGDDGDLNATPWASSEIVGVEGPRGLPHGGISTNQFTKYANDSYRLFFGSPPSGVVGAPSITATVDLLFGDLLIFGSDPTDAVYDEIMRYYLARPGTIAPVSNIDGLVDFLGDSRPRGNGATDLVHAVPGAMQTALGPRWQVENRGISGDNWDNMVLEPYLSQRIAHLYHSSRLHHQIFVWCNINSAKDSTHYPAPGMDAPTALARVTTLVNRIRQRYPDKSKVKIAICHDTGDASGQAAAQIAALNAGLDAMKASGFIDDAVPIETGADVLDFIDIPTDYSDGLHPANPVAGQIGVICANRASALAAAA